MTQNEKRVSGLLSGLLVVFLLVWFWNAIWEAIQYVFYLLFSVGLLFTYARWLYTARARRSWLAPTILLICLLLAACVEIAAYHRAHVVSYVREERWISETVFYTPEYDGEDEALALTIGGPLVGIGLLLLWGGRGQRNGQFAHYSLLLVTLYPASAVMLLSSIGTKSKYEEGAILPFVAGPLRLVGKGLPYRIYPTSPRNKKVHLRRINAKGWLL